MELPQYEFAPDDGCTFYFISKGKNGAIKKIIHYEEIAEGIFNLTLADNNPITGEWEDSAVTANDDTEKILATVVKSVYLQKGTLMLMYMLKGVLTHVIDCTEEALQNT